MKAKAEEYSFNIESQLFPTLNAEQQRLWKAEIEQAYKAGSGAITQDQIDALRMEYEKGRADAIAHPTGGELLHVLNKGHKQGYKDAADKLYEWLRTNHDEIFLRYIKGYNAYDEIELLKKYMEEQL